MPYAPEEVFSAWWFQWLSLVQSFSRQGIWSRPKPASSSSAQPIARLPLYSLQRLGDRTVVRLGGLLLGLLGSLRGGLLLRPPVCGPPRRPRPCGSARPAPWRSSPPGAGPVPSFPASRPSRIVWSNSRSRWSWISWSAISAAWWALIRFLLGLSVLTEEPPPATQAESSAIAAVRTPNRLPQPTHEVGPFVGGRTGADGPSGPGRAVGWHGRSPPATRHCCVRFARADKRSSTIRLAFASPLDTLRTVSLRENPDALLCPASLY